MEGCGALALPFSTFCVECDELPEDYYGLDDGSATRSPRR